MKSRRRGITLIELLVGVGMLVIVATVAGILLRDESRNYRQGREKVRLQSDAREAMRILESEVRNTAFGIHGTLGNRLQPGASLCPQRAVNATAGDSSSFVVRDAGTGRFDSLEILSLPIDPAVESSVNCANMLRIRYSVDAGSGTLVRSLLNPATGVVTGSTPFLAGVAAFQVQYGITRSDTALLFRAADFDFTPSTDYVLGGVLSNSIVTPGVLALTTRNPGSLTFGMATARNSRGVGEQVEIRLRTWADSLTTLGIASGNLRGFRLFLVNAGGSPASDTAAFAFSPTHSSDFRNRVALTVTQPAGTSNLRLRLEWDVATPPPVNYVFRIGAIEGRRVHDGRVSEWLHTVPAARKQAVGAVRLQLLVASDRDNQQGASSVFNGLGNVGGTGVFTATDRRAHVLHERIIPIVNARVVP